MLEKSACFLNTITRLLSVILLLGSSGIFLSCQAFALTVSDFSIFGDGKVTIGKNAKIESPGDPADVYRGKIGSNGSASGYALSLDTLVKAGDLYSGGTTFIGSYSKIDGKVVSADNLTADDVVSLMGPVSSGGTASIGRNSKINSSITAAGHTNFDQGVHVAGNVLSGSNMIAGENGIFDGNADVNGYVTLNRHTSIAGQVTHSGTLTLMGSDAVQATVGSDAVGTSIVSPEMFTSIVLPSASSFSSGGTSIIKADIQDTTLAPGTYGSLSLGDNNKLRLASGAYFFDKITAKDGLDIYVDLAGGELLLYVSGNVQFGENLKVILTNGTANDIYAEAHGTWFMDDIGEWYGTIYTPYKKLTIGENSDVYGSLYSGNAIDFQEGSKLHYYASDYLRPNDPDPKPSAVPEPGTLLLIGIGLAGMALPRRVSR